MNVIVDPAAEAVIMLLVDSEDVEAKEALVEVKAAFAREELTEKEELREVIALDAETVNEALSTLFLPSGPSTLEDSTKEAVSAVAVVRVTLNWLLSPFVKVTVDPAADAVIIPLMGREDVEEKEEDPNMDPVIP